MSDWSWTFHFQPPDPCAMNSSCLYIIQKKVFVTETQRVEDDAYIYRMDASCLGIVSLLAIPLGSSQGSHNGQVWATYKRIVCHPSSLCVFLGIPSWWLSLSVCFSVSHTLLCPHPQLPSVGVSTCPFVCLYSFSRFSVPSLPPNKAPLYQICCTAWRDFSGGHLGMALTGISSPHYIS